MVTLVERRELWVGLVSEQRASGLTASAWCREHGVQSASFYNWRKRLSVGEGNVPPPVEWLPVASAEAPALSSGLTLRVGAVCIDIASSFNRQVLSDVLGVLDARC
jgi:transposase-like protein